MLPPGPELFSRFVEPAFSALAVKGPDRVAGGGVVTHAERAVGHAGNGDAANIRALADQLVDRLARHVALYHIGAAVELHRNRMAGFHVGRDAGLALDGVEILDVVDGNIVTGGAHGVDPGLAAAAPGVLVNRHSGGHRTRGEKGDGQGEAQTSEGASGDHGFFPLGRPANFR